MLVSVFGNAVTQSGALLATVFKVCAAETARVKLLERSVVLTVVNEVNVDES